MPKRTKKAHCIQGVNIPQRSIVRRRVKTAASVTRKRKVPNNEIGEVLHQIPDIDAKKKPQVPRVNIDTKNEGGKELHQEHQVDASEECKEGHHKHTVDTNTERNNYKEHHQTWNMHHYFAFVLLLFLIFTSGVVLTHYIS